ncbi:MULTISPECIES: BadF/BadG/BcrA/BcrD ATPase family protein [Lactobacillus]|uniref:BadF/BadG/BcrA/BcrD ATPase family protein n=1 Tax=Lactobacillus TaxID=1578 RepID=UPI001C695033|nr:MULTISPECIES: BadF/BadG/BcrA/BcrD ATPase family protein [Lactobacillus]MCX8722037.1 N-acetylglucosamine kinase [Lactobacillus sp. B4010]MCX8732675.1 N-acetylglucosamine kinase [Lactobacillus sp. B4015]MCX8734895.1 N-acetylglucosamine kinase [Lactobacillus sp. B4012]QYN57541.1 N-acetylglucosamine kinase [Lactobacillus panisapium]
MQYRIGVDSGGTHVVANAYSKDLNSLSSVIFGPGNIFTNAEEAVTNISSAIKNAAIKGQTCEKILIGIAGLESSLSPELYLDKIKTNVKEICTDIHFISDAKLALINGLKGKDGFLTIAGTGSIVYGKQNEKYLRAGGWGYLLDDIGSAYRIAQEATINMLQDYDSGKPCSYQQTIFKYFHVQTVHELISKYYQIEHTQIANFSLELAKIAEKGDRQAVKVFELQGKQLAEEIIRLIQRYPANEIEYRLALSGSVLIKNLIVQNKVKEVILKKFPQMKITISTHNNNMAVNYI